MVLGNVTDGSKVGSFTSSKTKDLPTVGRKCLKNNFSAKKRNVKGEINPSVERK